ncbi:hypothetical protein B0I35DRAFT_448605 [Stachybotrys elegans]|uniref:Rhodopsin domain-containing protein n=1 Tax=Stachybotrys elegans TaxID=80388 RepID=A0A8K0T3I9_9HYPO|nr:hypothetical protein B0I35DRAFT_448605 [Stachybotrys elegans]
MSLDNGVLFVVDVPEGEVRSFDNPPSSAAAVGPTGIVTTAIAFICVALRLFTRTYVVQDLVMIAMILSIAFLCVGSHLYTIGAGRHMWDVRLDEYNPGFLQTTLGATLTYACSISFTKLSILAFYLRISPNVMFRRAVYSLIGLIVAYTITYIFLMIFRCQPVAYGWDITIPGGTCIGNLIPMMTLSVANIMLDTAVLLLPVGVVLPLQIPRRQKISLLFLFATGGFVIAAAIQRTVIMPPLLAAYDYTWLLSEQFIWSYVEVNAGILCASVPAMKPLFMRYLPWLVMSRLRSSQENSARYATGSGMDKQSKNRKPYGQAFELHSRPEDEARSSKEDDEAMLWETKRSSNKTEAKDMGDRKDSDSLDSVSERYLGRSGGATVTAGGYLGNSKKNSTGIQITRETTVSYQG